MGPSGIKGFIVNGPVSKTASPPWVRSPGPQSAVETPAGRKIPVGGTDVTSTFGHTPFASHIPASPVPLLPMPPSRGTPSTMRSEASRAWLNRYAMRSGLRSRTGMDARQMDRPGQHHTFLADVADVRQIEQGLLQLMEDFQAGSLRAFGKLIYFTVFLLWQYSLVFCCFFQCYKIPSILDYTFSFSHITS